MINSLNSYTSGPDEEGYFDIYGGKYVAETLMPLINQLEEAYEKANPDLSITLFTIVISVIIGSLTFTGSFIAFGKLQGIISTKPITFPGQQIFNAILAIIMISAASMIPAYGINSFYIILAISALLGILLVIPIGGADMPVVISLLNSYSGIAAAATGFVLGNNALIISGALVGASGLILTQIMCK